jgi:hypothetical protein
MATTYLGLYLKRKALHEQVYIDLELESLNELREETKDARVSQPSPKPRVRPRPLQKGNLERQKQGTVIVDALLTPRSPLISAHIPAAPWHFEARSPSALKADTCAALAIQPTTHAQQRSKGQDQKFSRRGATHSGGQKRMRHAVVSCGTARTCSPSPVIPARALTGLQYAERSLTYSKAVTCEGSAIPTSPQVLELAPSEASRPRSAILLSKIPSRPCAHPFVQSHALPFTIILKAERELESFSLPGTCA